MSDPICSALANGHSDILQLVDALMSMPSGATTRWVAVLARNRMMKGANLTTIALASAFALFSTFALANTVHRRTTIRTHVLPEGAAPIRSRPLHLNYGNPDGATSVSAGGYLWNGRSASELGGD
jgi:hypothetical protein